MRYAINLFPHVRDTLAYKVRFFAVHYLRYILVLTQFVVVIVYFYLFVVEHRILQQKQQLSRTKAIITTSTALRKDQDKLQKTLKNITTVLKAQDLWRSRLDYLNSRFPSGITLQSLSMEGESATIVLTSPDNSVIQSFYQRLVEDKRFKSVSLLGLSRTKDQAYELQMKLEGYTPPKS